MEVLIKRGYMLFDSGKAGPMYVAPHAAPAYEKPGDHQDHNTHFIAYRLALNGGRALVSSITRERVFGVDFYKPSPDMKTALSHYKTFESGRIGEKRKYRKKYAWVARNRDEHKIKNTIYNNFWSEIMNCDCPVVFVHRQFFNPVRHPSLLDVVPFNHRKKFREAVKKMNGKYRKIFEDLFPVYRKSFEFKTACVLFKEMVLNEYKLRLFHGRKPFIRKRIEKFSRKMEEMPYLEITYMKNFSGTLLKMILARHNIKNRKPIVQMEVSEFLARRFPDIAVYIISDIMKHVRK